MSKHTEPAVPVFALSFVRPEPPPGVKLIVDESLRSPVRSPLQCYTKDRLRNKRGVICYVIATASLGVF